MNSRAARLLKIYIYQLQPRGVLTATLIAAAVLGLGYTLGLSGADSDVIGASRVALVIALSSLAPTFADPIEHHNRGWATHPVSRRLLRLGVASAAGLSITAMVLTGSRLLFGRLPATPLLLLEGICLTTIIATTSATIARYHPTRDLAILVTTIVGVIIGVFQVGLSRWFLLFSPTPHSPGWSSSHVNLGLLAATGLLVLLATSRAAIR